MHPIVCEFVCLSVCLSVCLNVTLVGSLWCCFSFTVLIQHIGHFRSYSHQARGWQRAVILVASPGRAIFIFTSAIQTRVWAVLLGFGTSARLADAHVFALVQCGQTLTHFCNRSNLIVFNFKVASYCRVVNLQSIKINKSCVMDTTAGYVIMYIQNDVMMFKNVI